MLLKPLELSDMSFEDSLALLFVGAWISIVGGWALRYLFKKHGFIK